MSDSETESVSQQQISTGDPSDSETNPSSSTPKRPCKSMMGLSTQTQDAQSSSHTFMNDSNTRNTKVSQRANKRYKNRTHLISSSHSSKTSTPAASCTLKTRIGKGLAKLFGEKDDDIIAFDDIRDSIKLKRTQALTQKYNMLESKVSSRVLRLLSETSKQINEWEMDFLTMNEALPSSSDVASNLEISFKYRKRHLAQELLRSFNITVHVEN